MMETLLDQAARALEQKDGGSALRLAQQVLEQDENNTRAWLIAMKCFQLLYPIDQYDAENELTCARYAIRSASKAEKYSVRKQVYQFLLTKILEVLKRDEEVLADGRAAVSFYQRTVYFDAAHAAARTMENDKPVVDAVLRTFDYCRALFDFIPNSALVKSAALNRQAAAVAQQWRRTYSYLEIRYELYHTTLSRRAVEEGLRQYARFLRPVKNRDELLRMPVPFNLYRFDQTAY